MAPPPQPRDRPLFEVVEPLIFWPVWWWLTPCKIWWLIFWNPEKTVRHQFQPQQICAVSLCDQSISWNGKDTYPQNQNQWKLQLFQLAEIPSSSLPSLFKDFPNQHFFLWHVHKFQNIWKWQSGQRCSIWNISHNIIFNVFIVIIL